MKILYAEWNSYANEYVKQALRDNGHSLEIFPFPASANTKSNEELTTNLVIAIINLKVDCCFSLNYYPVIAMACKACKIKYISWTYDSPYVHLYSDTIKFSTNYAFVFDKAEFTNLKRIGIETVYYLPMGAPVEIYEKLIPSDKHHQKYDADVSMVGSMYSEKKHQLFNKLDLLSDYSRGYIEALVSSQKFLYGTDIIEPALSKDIIADVQKSAPALLPEDELQTPEWLYSKYFLLREVTRREREEYITSLSSKLNFTLYTHEKNMRIKNVVNKGPLDYYSEMPYAMKCSKINLNISLRSIVSGMPLRTMDILGCGGFLLTNYQADFLDYFVPGEDFVYFENIEDLEEKCSYYLSHENERKEVAASALEKMKKNHTYTQRIQSMMHIIQEDNHEF